MQTNTLLTHTQHLLWFKKVKSQFLSAPNCTAELWQWKPPFPKKSVILWSSEILKGGEKLLGELITAPRLFDSWEKKPWRKRLKRINLLSWLNKDLEETWVQHLMPSYRRKIMGSKSSLIEASVRWGWSQTHSQAHDQNKQEWAFSGKSSFQSIHLLVDLDQGNLKDWLWPTTNWWGWKREACRWSGCRSCCSTGRMISGKKNQQKKPLQLKSVGLQGKISFHSLFVMIYLCHIYLWSHHKYLFICDLISQAIRMRRKPLHYKGKDPPLLCFPAFQKMCHFYPWKYPRTQACTFLS